LKNITYHREVRDLIASFVAAFDNIVINRYDITDTAQNKLQVRYVYAPKERVLYDLVNKAGNITLPVVSVWMTSFSRDNSRVFNKINGFDFGRKDPFTASNHVGAPVPVNIGVSMSIMTKFQADMDQIISNWVPYNNPYIIISWKVPQDFNLSYNYEIRSEVLWDGNITLDYPIELNATQKYKAVANTSFIIKGWLFPAAPTTSNSIIYNISAFHHVNSILTDYATMSADTISYPVSSGLVHEVETVVINASQTPEFSLFDDLSSTIVTDTSAIIVIPSVSAFDTYII
jgi:hypothetical protein